MANNTRPIRRWYAAVIVAGLLCVALLVPAMTSAQEERTVIVVDAEVRVIGEQYHGGYIRVHVDGELCGEFSFTDPEARTPDGGAEFELARDDQPDECGREGARILLADGNGTVLSNQLTLVRGTTLPLGWFQAGAIRFEPAPTSDGRTLLTLAPEQRDVGERFESARLEVYADGEYCGHLSFIEPDIELSDGGVALELARDDQPEACGRDGAVISLVNALGHRLAAVYRLDVGWQIPVQNFTIPPPHTGGGEPAPGAPDAGTGLATGPGEPAGRLPATLALAVLAIGLSLIVVTRLRRDRS
jgi:hypothetical protein